MQAEEETNITELEILSDGRICVFGASREVLEIFDAMPMLSGEVIRHRLNQQQKTCSGSDKSVQTVNEKTTVATQRSQK